MTSALMSSQSAEEVERKETMRRRVEFQQIEQSAKEEATSYGDSAGCNCSSAGCYLELAMAKRCRLHKLVRQRFAFAHIIQQDGSYIEDISRSAKRRSADAFQRLQNDVVRISWNDSVLYSRRKSAGGLCVDEDDQQDDLCEEPADALQR
ncbi:protein ACCUMULATION AND REPLICATION OF CHLOROPLASTS 3 [Dorcoceras hygrometricum]|uniref:Protein ACCUMULATION AND REPLICATION OF CHLOROPLASTS 3 n=1 Tax=Dorcoceras hygrometricum TaxID=472368 RepID=A0A2Z7AP39_9LAMI|nr:protein ACCUMULATION AND REPLICATION OF CHLOROPLASTS 3 [Dorcoceras hygrometricum]